VTRHTRLPVTLFAIAIVVAAVAGRALLFALITPPIASIPPGLVAPIGDAALLLLLALFFSSRLQAALLLAKLFGPPRFAPAFFGALLRAARFATALVRVTALFRASRFVSAFFSAPVLFHASRFVPAFFVPPLIEHVTSLRAVFP